MIHIYYCKYSWIIRKKEYINSLSKQEVETMELAKKLLTSSFDLKKSNAFLKWYNSSS